MQFKSNFNYKSTSNLIKLIRNILICNNYNISLLQNIEEFI